MTKTNFQRVAEMNTAFGNPPGNPDSFGLDAVRNQTRNILDEYCEIQIALGADPATVQALRQAGKGITYTGEANLDDVRDGLCDVHVFAYGAHHLMGIDADRDMNAVVDGVMTRFIKDEADKEATIALHAARGVTDVYFEGQYPVMVMKSASDQPDAPKGKFLKSASYNLPVFYKADTFSVVFERFRALSELESDEEKCIRSSTLGDAEFIGYDDPASREYLKAPRPCKQALQSFVEGCSPHHIQAMAALMYTGRDGYSDPVAYWKDELKDTLSDKEKGRRAILEKSPRLDYMLAAIDRMPIDFKLDDLPGLLNQP